MSEQANLNKIPLNVVEKVKDFEECFAREMRFLCSNGINYGSFDQLLDSLSRIALLVAENTPMIIPNFPFGRDAYVYHIKSIEDNRNYLRELSKIIRVEAEQVNIPLLAPDSQYNTSECVRLIRVRDELKKFANEVSRGDVKEVGYIYFKNSKEVI